MDSNDATRTGQTAAAAHETGARPRIGALPGVPVPGQTHPHTLRTATHRWWKPVVGILGGVIAMFVLNLALVLGAAAVDGLVLGIEFGTLTPLMYGAGLVGLILLIPLTWLLVRSLHGQPFGYTFSVAGRMRWRYVLGVSPVFLVLFSLYMTAFTLMGPDMGQRSDNWWIYAVVGVLLLPFQSAAEEIFFRGYVQRAAGAWVSGENASFIVGTLVSALLFMAAHVAADLWLNLYYVCFGIILSLSVRLTGGLEVAIVLHAVNNVAAGVIGAYTSDIEGAFDRSAGVGGPFMLIQIAVVALSVAGLVWCARRLGLRQRVAA